MTNRPSGPARRFRGVAATGLVALLAWLPADAEPLRAAEPFAAPEAAKTADASPAPSEPARQTGPDSQADLVQTDIVAAQKRIADRYKSLRDKLTHMADLLAASNPRQAALLREAVGKSNDLGIDERLEKIALLLRDQQLSAGVRSQTDVQRDLAKILDLLLSEDKSKRLESEKERIKNYLKWLNSLIKEQKALEAETGRLEDVKPLAERQGQLADRACELANKIEKNESPRDASAPRERPSAERRPDRPADGESPGDRGPRSQDPPSKQPGDDGQGAEKPSQSPSQPGQPQPGQPKDGQPMPGEPQPGQPAESQRPAGAPPQGAQESPAEGSPAGGASGEPTPSHPAQKRVEQAQQKMQEAAKRLQDAEKDGAKSRQQQAIKELEQAKAELESILRQLREEEQVQTLKLLEARLSAMLKMQNDVWEGTKRLDKKPPEQRDHDDEIESGRLARREAEILVEADKALALLREEAKAIAFIEALAEVRLEIQQVVELLNLGKTGLLTQGTEEEIVKSLEEMLAATKKARKDRENQKNQPPQPPGGDGDDPPLVDGLAQIKMIRSMQVRINNQTQRFIDAIARSSAADRAELAQGLKRLSDSQERVRRITRDLAAGRNQ